MKTFHIALFNCTNFHDETIFIFEIWQLHFNETINNASLVGGAQRGYRHRQPQLDDAERLYGHVLPISAGPNRVDRLSVFSDAIPPDSADIWYYSEHIQQPGYPWARRRIQSQVPGDFLSSLRISSRRASRGDSPERDPRAVSKQIPSSGDAGGQAVLSPGLLWFPEDARLETDFIDHLQPVQKLFAEVLSITFIDGWAKVQIHRLEPGDWGILSSKRDSEAA